MNAQVAEKSQNTSSSNDNGCANRGLEGHTEWDCQTCHERFDQECDEVLRGSMLTYQGWTEKQIEALSSFRRFDKTPWADLKPDQTQPKNFQTRTWALNYVNELQARMDAAREYHENMTAQHHLQNDGKASNLTLSSVDGAACKDDDGNEMHPQWTCNHCLARLNDHFDHLLREAMIDQGWTEAEIDTAGSLRQFDTKSWSEMRPDPSQSQLAQVRAWGETRLRELEARMDNTRHGHTSKIGSDETVDEAE